MIYAPDLPFPGDATYDLRSIMCFYLQHFLAYVRNVNTGEWVMHDDANIKLVKDWDAVRHKCSRGHQLPATAFYCLREKL